MQELPVSPPPYPTERTAIVTGAASARGIGKDLSHRLSEAGWHLGLIDIAPWTPDTTAALRAVARGRLSFASADIASAEDVERAAQQFEAELPPVLAVVNVAGISDPTPFLQTSLERWERVIRVNLTGSFLVTQRFLPGMVDRGVGRVVSLSSTAAQSGGGTYSAAAYSASKAGIEGMTRAVALEVAAKGVTVNAVSPAIIDTDIMGGRIDEDRLSYFTSRLPVGRLGRAEEVSALIEFLIGPTAGYITGATYNINGGARIG
jgi:2-hydroxycyclohexanecarboxyl-CoA dehydrogenase